MTRVGDSPPRPDGLAKVGGTARFADDFTLPGMLHGATLRSPHPHARIEAVRVPAELPADTFAVTAAGLPGPNGVQLLTDDWPILADRAVRHVGEPVALVAAPTRLAARRALALVEVDYAPLEPVLDLEAADREPPLCALAFGEPEIEQALAAAEVVVEGEYRTGHQEHVYIECQGMTAWFEPDGGLTVAGSMQCPYYVHKSLVHALGLPADRVRVRATAVGGGFGGKEDYPSVIALHAALLARASGRPVRLVYDRHEDIVGTTKRHPAVVRHRTGVARDGTLLAMDVEVVMDGGAYTTLSPVVLSRALLHAGGAYRCPSVRVRGRVLRTNTATNGAFRGFGAPQTQFAVERQIDRIAARLGLDPLEIRRRNALRPGDRLPTGQVLDETTAALECLERAAELTDFSRRWREGAGAWTTNEPVATDDARLEGACAGPKAPNSGEGTPQDRAPAGRGAGTAPLEKAAPLRGLGLSLYFHGAGFTGNGERRMRSPVTARLTADGRLEVLTAMTDMGQGCAAIFPQMACSATGLTDDDLSFPEPDTGTVPDSGPTVASRTTMIVGGALVEAVRGLRDRVLDAWRDEQGLDGELTVGDGTVTAAAGGSWPFREVARAVFAARGPLEVTRRHEPPAGQEFDETTYRGAAYPTYAWGADVVEVEVDPDTLEVRPLAVTAVCEVGRAIHPVLCAGQIEGGTLQAVAWGLMEEVKLDRGRYLNDRLATYIIPTAMDAPRLDVHLLEKPWAGGPFGAKGVGELPMDGGAPAAVAAVENATGIAAAEIPATPERLMAARAARAAR
jgi:CO/xanthine dehydrogenase Mo-binding subunit